MNKLFSSLTVRKKVALTFLAAMLSLSNLAYAQPDRKNLKSLQWITGTWKIQLKNGNLYETWNYVNDSTFQGRSFIVKSSGDTIPQESIQITLRKKEMYYTPTAKGQNNDQPVPFKIATMEKNGFVSENPAHDFPQRIIYSLKSPTQLYARIEGTINGEFKKQEFNMEKVQ